MGYQTGDDGLPGRGRVTTLTNYQNEIHHSLIFTLVGSCALPVFFLFSETCLLKYLILAFFHGPLIGIFLLTPKIINYYFSFQQLPL